MSSLVVEGHISLHGAIRATGNKNEALPAVAAALLSPKPVVLENFPDIGDLGKMLAIAGELGATVGDLVDGRVEICAESLQGDALPLELSSRIRGSILFASALLVRQGKAVVPQPGGDAIGRRPLDMHFLVFEALGARLEVVRPTSESDHGITQYSLHAPDGLKGADIFLPEASVTGTENALIAASGARGRTVISNAASEPHVQGLCRLLVAMGASIQGIGSNVLVVEGTDTFKPVTHALGSDFMEVGSLIGLAAATRSDVTIEHVDVDDLRMILHQFGRLGVEVALDRDARTVHVPDRQTLEVRKDLGDAIPNLYDQPWPGFPPDLMSVLVVLATQCTGTCLIHEKMFESRLYFVDWLITMGAQIVLCDPHRAVVVGPTPLYGATIMSPDIRAGMALLIAALAAEGRTVIHNVEQIDRGYQAIDERLNALGARISRRVDRRKS